MPLLLLHNSLYLSLLKTYGKMINCYVSDVMATSHDTAAVQYLEDAFGLRR